MSRSSQARAWRGGLPSSIVRTPRGRLHLVPRSLAVLSRTRRDQDGGRKRGLPWCRAAFPRCRRRRSPGHDQRCRRRCDVAARDRCVSRRGKGARSDHGRPLRGAARACPMERRTARRQRGDTPLGHSGLQQCGKVRCRDDQQLSWRVRSGAADAVVRAMGFAAAPGRKGPVHQPRAARRGARAIRIHIRSGAGILRGGTPRGGASESRARAGSGASWKAGRARTPSATDRIPFARWTKCWTCCAPRGSLPIGSTPRALPDAPGRKPWRARPSPSGPNMSGCWRRGLEVGSGASSDTKFSNLPPALRGMSMQ